jgi:hypothetical protein
MISASHCFNHAERLAVARCPECTRSYCRECVTEHDEKLICAACLRKRAPAIVRKRDRRRALALPTLGVAALFGSWLLFYTAGWWLEEITAPAARIHSVRAVQR